MTPHSRILALLLIALALGSGAVPAVQAQDTGEADLALGKVLFQTGEQLFAGDQVSWNLTLTNYGPDDATNIQVTEDYTGLGAFTLDAFEAGEGTTFADPLWTIPSLAVGEYTTLNLTTTIQGDGDITNTASIMSADQTDPIMDNNEATVSTALGASITAEIDVKPETLNLGSRGVFTVFIRFEGDYNPNDVNLEESSLFCNGAGAKKLHLNQKDGGTLMAKFPRQELTVTEPDTEPGDDDTTGDGATGEDDADDGSSDGLKTLTITCEGTVQFGDETVEVSGTDTIRVIGEKKKGLGALLARFLDTVLPVDDGAGDAAGDDGTPTTATPAPGQKPTLNRGQLKKAGGDQTCTGDCSTATTPGSQGNGKKSGTSDDTPATGSQYNGKETVTPDNDTDTGSQGKGNQGNGNGKDTGNAGDNGNSGGKEKGTGNGKK